MITRRTLLRQSLFATLSGLVLDRLPPFMSSSNTNRKPIDRKSVVTRHNVTRKALNRRSPFHVRKDSPPLLLITGDRNLEMLGRYEENAYLWRMMKLVGHKDVELFELQGFDHGQMATPAFPLMMRFIQKHDAPPK